MSIDILYIHPLGYNPSFSKKYFRKDNKNNAGHFFGFIPMGVIGAINTLIKNRISVRGVNLSLKKRLNPGFNLKSCLEFYRPKIVLIDMHWYVHIKHGIEIVKECKKIGCQIIVGGLSATLFHEELIKIKEIDYVVKGDAEKPLLELAKALLNNKEKDSIENICSKKSNNPIKYCCADINNYDYLNLNFLEDKEAYLEMFDSWLLVGKGCPYDCRECDGSKKNTKILFHRNRAIFRDEKTLLKDLNSIKSETVNFSLDICIMPDKIIGALSNQHFNLNLRNEFFQLADINRLKKIKNSFRSFDLVFSPASGNDDERKKYGKNFTNKQFLECLRSIDKEDINGGIIIYFTDYMVSPLKTEKLNEKARKELIKEIEKIVPYALIKVLPQIVDPGTLRDKMPIGKIFSAYTNP